MGAQAATKRNCKAHRCCAMGCNSMIAGGRRRDGALASYVSAHGPSFLPSQTIRTGCGSGATQTSWRIATGDSHSVRIERRRARVKELAARLETLSPLATLARGYAVALNEKGGALPSAAMIRPGMHFAMEMRDGRVHATADEVIVRPQANATQRGAA